MILHFRITKEQKQALLSFYPEGVKYAIKKIVYTAADKIIIERDLFNIDEELKAYHNRQILTGVGPHRKRIVTPETRAKISKALKGKYLGIPLLEETKVKIGLIHKGKIVSEETRKKISLANKGKHYKKCAKVELN